MIYQKTTTFSWKCQISKESRILKSSYEEGQEEQNSTACTKKGTITNKTAHIPGTITNKKRQPTTYSKHDVAIPNETKRRPQVNKPRANYNLTNHQRVAQNQSKMQNQIKQPNEQKQEDQRKGQKSRKKLKDWETGNNWHKTPPTRRKRTRDKKQQLKLQ